MWDKYVLFIDGEAIVIDKPAGLAVHPGSRTPESLEDYLKHFRFGFKRAPLPVHRLDRDTSGCLLLARNPKAHKRFQAAFEAGEVAKAYAAVIAGEPAGESGTIDLPLRKVSSVRDGWRMVADPDGQSARTEWSVVTCTGGETLVIFRPMTGRTHQIRAHAAYGLGLPVVGDPVYGRPGREPMLLHAAALTVPRGSKAPLAASSPLPERFGYFADMWSIDGG